MEDKNATLPNPCVNGCGFYGNPIYEMMCSKCYKDTGKAKSAKQSTASAADAALKLTNKIEKNGFVEVNVHKPSLACSSVASVLNIKEEVKAYSEPVTPSEEASVKIKNRCQVCRSKVPLVKQTTNRCRCDNVFCDSHKFPDTHNCSFDFETLGKELLKKNNPKLNDKPRGGRGFNRIGD